MSELYITAAVAESIAQHWRWAVRRHEHRANGSLRRAAEARRYGQSAVAERNERDALAEDNRAYEAQLAADGWSLIAERYRRLEEEGTCKLAK